MGPEIKPASRPDDFSNPFRIHLPSGTLNSFPCDLCEFLSAAPWLSCSCFVLLVGLLGLRNRLRCNFRVPSTTWPGSGKALASSLPGPFLRKRPTSKTFATRA